MTHDSHPSAFHILGAGPSGLSAAILLRQAGHQVHVHERYDAIGKRFQGDLQGLENWSTKQDVLKQFKQFGIETNFKMTPFHEVSITDGKNLFQNSSKEPLFYLVKRGVLPDTLDTSLKNQALKQGVEIHYRSTIPQKEAHIIATGPIRHATVAADRGIIFRSELPNLAVAIFHDDFAHLGYSYLLIADGYGCLCSVVFKDLHRLNQCFEKTIEIAKKMYPLKLDEAQPVGGIGGFVFNHTATHNGSLLVGEAAGLQDFLWGFGIRSAVTSGYLAAQSLMEKKDYSSLLKEHYSDYLKATLVNRYLWEKFKSNNKPLLPYFMKMPLCLRKQFHLLFKYTPVHRMLYPFARSYIKKEYPEIFVG